MELKWHKTNYKLLTGKWKIGILLEAGYCVVQSLVRGELYIKIARNIYFLPKCIPYPNSQLLSRWELNYFCNGLKLVKEQIIEKQKELAGENITDGKLVIILRSVQFSDCNIQDEAFAVTAIQWAAEVFDFMKPEVTVSFDKNCTVGGLKGRYFFDFSTVRNNSNRGRLKKLYNINQNKKRN